MKNVLLSDMTWQEFADIIGEVEVALIPIGSTEQHGPHLALKTDSTLVYEIAKKVADELYPKVVITPLIEVGISPHHMNKPGTLTLRPQTFIDLIIDICKSLKHHGIKRVLLLNGHGGNYSALRMAGRDIEQELDLKIAAMNYGDVLSKQETATILESRVAREGLGGHACEAETSLGMALDPAMVRTEKIVKQEKTELPRYIRKDLGGHFLVGSDATWSKSGVKPDGDPTLATLEKGEKLVNMYVKKLVEFLNYFTSYQ